MIDGGKSSLRVRVMGQFVTCELASSSSSGGFSFYFLGHQSQSQERGIIKSIFTSESSVILIFILLTPGIRRDRASPLFLSC